MLKDIYYKRTIPVYYDEKIKNFQIDLLKLREIIQADVKQGLIPFWYGATVGTTPSGANDQIKELIDIC